MTLSLHETGPVGRSGQDIASNPAMDTLQLRRIFSKFATGVTVVTAQSETGPIGITCNSFASLSLEPPLLLWSLRKASSKYAPFANARHFTVNVLAANQMDLAGAFAKSGHNPYEGLDFKHGQEGVPVLRETAAHFECEVEATQDAGDHLLIIGRIVSAGHTDSTPLVFSEGRYVDTIERQPT
jgi:flavin reductase (DIM6/NTAB) family NADH-FMN oxidoreductase RutF